MRASALSLETQAELLGIALLVASRQFARELLRPIFEEDFERIQEVGIVQEWLQEREARGETKGVRETLLRLGRKRFGEPSAEVIEALEAVSSVETLPQLAERMLEVENWQELLTEE